MVNTEDSSKSSSSGESDGKNPETLVEILDIQKHDDASDKEVEQEENGEVPSVVTEAGEDGDDEQSALQDLQMEPDRRRVRKLRRKKVDAECSTESSEETETMTLRRRSISASSKTEGTESPPEEVVNSEAIKSNDPIFDAIIEAVRNEKFDYAMELLRSYEKILNTQEKKNGKPESITEMAARGMTVEMCALLRSGANPLEATCGGNTALHWAAAGGHLECVSSLIEHGVHLDPLNEWEQTPLMLAAQNGHADVVSFLLELGASRDFQLNRFGDSPLTLACFNAREDVIDILLNSEQRPIEQCELNAALSRSALGGDLTVALLLLERGADVNLYESVVIPPLHAAIFGGNAVMVELLIAGGADVEMPNQGGYRPLMEAVRRGHRDIAESLLLAGAEVEAASVLDHTVTALSLAIDCGHDRLLVLLEKFRALEHSN